MPKPKSARVAKARHKPSKDVPAHLKPAAQPQTPARPAVWRPGKDSIEEGEELDYDPTAYDCLHAFCLEWPCLSFDVLRDNGGAPRTAFPHMLYLAAGTQARRGSRNSLVLVKLSDIGQGRHGRRRAGLGTAAGAGAGDGDDDSESEEEEEEEEELPVLHSAGILVAAGVNRVRACPQRPHLVAAWLDSGLVEVYDVRSQLKKLEAATDEQPLRLKAQQQKPLQAHAHSSEGFAVDWSPHSELLLASGDCRGRIHVWEPRPDGVWAVGKALRGHEGSVEDIQWSPGEPSVFLSASADKTLRVWDYRAGSSPQLTVQAHDTDVNVLSWNRIDNYLVATGADDGSLRIWDLRQFGGDPNDSCMATFPYHQAPITAVEWSPFEASMLVASAGDQQISLWDLSVERDPEEEAALALPTSAAVPDQVPPQLLFQHCGQTDMKEVHWHVQIPGLLLSTALDGFNVFMPENAKPDRAQPMQS